MADQSCDGTEPTRMEDDRPTEQVEETAVTFREISPALEFICWVTLGLTPMLRLVNGPPVTDDQAIIQTSLVVLAVTGALSLRLYNWLTPTPPSLLRSFENSHTEETDSGVCVAELATSDVNDAASRSLTPLADPKLSVVVPIFNEPKTVGDVVNLLLEIPLVEQIVLVNDGSHSETSTVLDELAETARVELFRHETNQGKGAALRTGIAACRNALVVIQDADLEYSPSEIPKLIEPIVTGHADIVYGTRFSNEQQNSLPLSRRLANRFLTWLSNRLTGLSLSDMETGHKVFRRDVLNRIEIQEDRFGVEPELTAKLAKKQLRFEELPVSYRPRGYAAGKKIGFSDGLRAVWCIWKYR